MIGTLAALGAVLGALVLLRAGLGALGLAPHARGAGRRLRVVESCALGTRARLHVVELEGRRLLVAHSEAGVTLLDRLPAASPADASAAAPEVASRGIAQGIAGSEAAAEVRKDPAPAMDRPAVAVARSAAAHGPAGPDRRGSAGEAPPVSVIDAAETEALPAATAGLARTRRRRAWRWAAPLGTLLVVLAVPWVAGAQGEEAAAAAGAALGLPGVDVAAAAAPDRISNTLEIVALLTLLSIAPSILLLGTCFTRVIVVLALLRQAIGINQLPPNQVLVGLALFITFFVMAPLGRTLQAEALDPYVAREIDAAEAAQRAMGPVRGFLTAHTREKDMALFVSLSGEPPPETPEQAPLSVLLPSYVISELRTAFEIGFTIFLPFLVIDLVVASMLISMGMIVLPPIVISLPFKLMLFVLLDGWNLVVGSLVAGLR